MSTAASERRALIFSIRPEWVSSILTGTKRWELRRRPPKTSEPTKALIYETAPGCRLRAIGKAGPIVSGEPDMLWNLVSKEAGVSYKSFSDYFFGCECAHAIRFSEVTELTWQPSLTELRNLIVSGISTLETNRVT